MVFGFTSLSALKLKRELNYRNNTKNSINQIISKMLKSNDNNEEKERAGI
jgi:hypothetical protein